jgi:copper chaperone CopZ
MSKIVWFVMILAFPAAASAKAQTALYTMKKWNCAGCAAKSANALKHIDGITEVKTDVDKKELTVVFEDAKIKEPEVAAAVKKLQFDCE